MLCSFDVVVLTVVVVGLVALRLVLVGFRFASTLGVRGFPAFGSCACGFVLFWILVLRVGLGFCISGDCFCAAWIVCCGQLLSTCLECLGC